jgi:hypothetical protein
MNHHLVEQAPGDGRSGPRPLLGANGFVFNTNRRGVTTGSNGQEEHAGLALLAGVQEMESGSMTTVRTGPPGEWGGV